jgi:hypothetical protein
MKAWIRHYFRDPKTAFASAMAVAGSVGILCCLAIIAIVVFTR